MPNAKIDVLDDLEVKVHDQNETFKVNSGSRTTYIKGKDTAIFNSSRKEYVLSKGQKVTINGGEVHNVISGGQIVKVVQNNQDVKVSANRNLTVDSMVSDTYQDIYDLEVGSSTLKNTNTDGSLTLDSVKSQKSTVTGLSTVNLKGGLFEICGGSVTLNDNQGYSNVITGPMDLQVNGTLELKSSGKTTFKGTTTAEINAPTVTINASSKFSNDSFSKYITFGVIKADFYNNSFYTRIVEQKINGLGAITVYGMKLDAGFKKKERRFKAIKNNGLSFEITAGPFIYLKGLYMRIQAFRAKLG